MTSDEWSDMLHSSFVIYDGLLRQRRARKINRKRRPLAHTRLHTQGAFGLFDEPLDDVQAEARALPGAFGGEVRLENLRQHFRRNAGTVIADRKLQDRPGVGEICGGS